MVALPVLPEISPPASAGCPVCLCPERCSRAFSREDHSVISPSQQGKFHPWPGREKRTSQGRMELVIERAKICRGDMGSGPQARAARAARQRSLSEGSLEKAGTKPGTGTHL